MNALKSFPIAVDTFLVLSGLLVTYNFFKQVAKNPKMVKEPHSWLMMYVHRYLRLTPSYILFIGFLLAVVPLLSGIVTFHKDVDGSLLEPCREHWWKNLFYVNNLFTVDQVRHDFIPNLSSYSATGLVGISHWICNASLWPRYSWLLSFTLHCWGISSLWLLVLPVRPIRLIWSTILSFRVRMFELQLSKFLFLNLRYQDIPSKPWSVFQES